MVPDQASQVDRQIAGVFTAIFLVLTGFYFAGPLLIAVELLKPAFSIPLLVLFGAWFWILAIATTSSSESPGQNEKAVRGSILVNWILLIACLVLCLVWVYLSGIGGFAYCREDYMKHNFIFSQLMEERLPIQVSYKGRQVLLHYGMAYYITPVRVTEFLQPILNIQLNFALIFIYSIILFISIALLAAIHRISVPWLCLSLALIGGLDVLGALAFGLSSGTEHLTTIPYLNMPVVKSLEWWGTQGAPESLTHVLFWAPQHFFGALIGTALLYMFLESSRPSTVLLADTIILIAASAFWSPYVAIGLALLLMLELSTNYHGAIQGLRGERLAALRSGESLTAYAFAGALGIYVWLYYAAAEPLSNPRLLLGHANLVAGLLTYVLNYAPFLLGLVFVSVPQAWEGSQDPSSEGQGLRRQLFWRLAGGLAMSAGLLSISHGLYNDWAMRTTLPLSITLTIAITQLILSTSLKQQYRALLLGVFVLSAVSALNDLAQAILLNRNCAPYGSYRLEDLDDLGDIAHQYQGRRDSFLYSYFVRWR